MSDRTISALDAIAIDNHLYTQGGPVGVTFIQFDRPNSEVGILIEPAATIPFNGLYLLNRRPKLHSKSRQEKSAETREITSPLRL